MGHKDMGNTLQREKTIFMELDVSSMAKVRQFAKEYEESGRDVHVLLCNAGVINAERSITKDGLDNTLTANCLGHFLLLELLLPIMKKTEAQGGSPRIVMVTSALALINLTMIGVMRSKPQPQRKERNSQGNHFQCFPV